MKGAIRPDHIPVNKYQLLVLGLPPLTITELSGIEDTLQTATMPDRTVASGGNREASESTAMTPMHHKAEQLIWEAWYRESQDPVLPTYKKTATLVHQSISGAVVQAYQLVGVFPKKRKLPDLEMQNEGELSQVEWTLSIDDIVPLP